MEEKLKGVVLGGVNYSENDKILKIFTLEKGVVSAKIKGVKKAGAKLKFASEPFCFAEFIFSFSGDKRTVINASLIDSFYPLRENIEKYYCGCAVLEYVKNVAKENIVNEQGFVLLIETLKQLAYGEKENYSVLTKFFIHSLALTGYGITISKKCYSCGKEIENKPYFDYITGAFYCDEDRGEYAREINYSTFCALNKALVSDLEKSEGYYSLKLIDFYLDKKLDCKLMSLSFLQL